MSRKKNRTPRSPKRFSYSRGGTIMGVFVGMILGAVIVTIAVAIFNQNDNPFSQTLSTKQAADTATATQQTPPSVAALPGKPGDRPAEKPDYTFFNTLPNGENAPITPLPPAELPQPQATIAPAQTTTPTKQIYLQLAAFENAEQADDLKARLLLMGLDPVTQRAQLPDGRIVHRIRIGPFTDREDLKAMRARLVSSGFSAEEVSN